jgi:hypothetical protein
VYLQGTPLLPMNAEFGMPPWLFGMHSYEVLAGGSSILAVYSDPAAAGAARCNGAGTQSLVPALSAMSLGLSLSGYCCLHCLQ